MIDTIIVNTVFGVNLIQTRKLRKLNAHANINFLAVYSRSYVTRDPSKKFFFSNHVQNVCHFG
jgi:ribosome biogenesis protein Nip4